MFRITPGRVAQLVVLLVPSLCQAQSLSQDRQTSAEILVRVTFGDDRAAGDQIRADLVNDSGVLVAESFTDPEGHAKFHVSTSGTYEVRVSGTPIQGTTVQQIRVYDMDNAKTIFLRVKPATNAASVAGRPNVPPVTSAAELRVPADARKAFHKGMEALERNDFAKAAEQFEKAVSLYPQYNSAFNNLGVMYYQMNQKDKAKAAFERSVELNDKNADADRNLARILIHDGDVARAEGLLKKSLMVEPLNPVTLTLLCVSEMQTGNYDGALLAARKVHQLPHEGYSLVHYVAGQALEQKGQLLEAYAEYETYLHESPGGPDVPKVRSALARLTAASRPNAQ